MCNADVTQSKMISYGTQDQRMTQDQRIQGIAPFARLWVLAVGILAALNADFEVLYAKTGRPSILPEVLLRVSLSQIPPDSAGGL